VLFFIGRLCRGARETSGLRLRLSILDNSERSTDKPTSHSGGATIKTMNNETVNNVLASLYESLSDEAKEMMLDIFREEDGE